MQFINMLRQMDVVAVRHRSMNGKFRESQSKLEKATKWGVNNLPNLISSRFMAFSLF
jgi:hypothetical protein